MTFGQVFMRDYIRIIQSLSKWTLSFSQEFSHTACSGTIRQIWHHYKQQDDTYFPMLSTQMRTTFAEIHLFNNDFFQHVTSFIFNGKGMGIVDGGERMREKECARRRAGGKGCGMGHKP